MDKNALIVKESHLQFWCNIECSKQRINGRWGLNLKTDAVMMAVGDRVYEEPQAQIPIVLHDDGDKLEFIRCVLRNAIIDYKRGL